MKSCSHAYTNTYQVPGYEISKTAAAVGWVAVRAFAGAAAAAAPAPPAAATPGAPEGETHVTSTSSPPSELGLEECPARSILLAPPPDIAEDG